MGEPITYLTWIAIIVGGLVVLLLVALLFWLATNVFNSDNVSMNFMEWLKTRLLVMSRRARFRTLFANLFFHLVFLGLFIKPLYLPGLPDEHWIGLIVMVFIMGNIIAYFYGWDMTFRTTVAADAPKYQRVISLIVTVVVYLFVLLIWLGVIGDLPNGTGAVLK